jgi:hypothetical protein
MNDAGVSLDAACRRVGLVFRCEASDRIPSFSLTIDSNRDEDGCCLCLVLNRNGRVETRVVDASADHEGILLAIEIRSVRREPVLELWLPQVIRHHFLVHRRDGAWVVDEIVQDEKVNTVAEALAGLKRGTDRTD